jgi:thiosulfate reductase cytochrome b subunit
MGRRWHFFFGWLFVANGAIYASLALLTGHIRRDLVPSLSNLLQIGHSIRQHLRLRFPKGEEARQYNVLQKFAYLGVVCVLCPLIVLAGLAISPQLVRKSATATVATGKIRAMNGGPGFERWCPIARQRHLTLCSVHWVGSCAQSGSL